MALALLVSEQAELLLGTGQVFEQDCSVSIALLETEQLERQCSVSGPVQRSAKMLNLELVLCPAGVQRLGYRGDYAIV